MIALNNKILNNLEVTKEIAKEIASSLKAGNIIAFYGDLGAGKTTIIQNICEYLGVKEEVTSPTFTIINEYFTANQIPVYHFDFYRLKNTTELRALNFEDYIFGNGICFFEWPEKIEAFLPKNIIKFEIYFNKNSERVINIKA